MNTEQHAALSTPVADSAHADCGVNLRQIVLCLSCAQRAMNDDIEGALAPEQMQLVDWLIVGELANGPSSLSALSRSLQRDPGSLSRAVSRLAGRRLITSLRQKRDRRRVRIALTPEGREAHLRLTQRITHLIERLPNPMGQWGLDELHSFLEQEAGIAEGKASVSSDGSSTDPFN